MAKPKEPDWSKLSQHPANEAELLHKAATKARAAREARPKPRPKQEFARITADLFPLIAKLDKPAIQLLLVLVMLSGRRRARLSDGWLALPKAAFQPIGLEDRKARFRATSQLISYDVLETRQPGSGRALEYRLRLPVPSGTTH